MNSNLIPLGPTETLVLTAQQVPAANAVGDAREIQLLEAETDFVITAIAYRFPASPAHAQAVSAFTLKQGRHLFHVKSVTGTGTVTVIYRSNP